eukprot:7389051-Prymnesium_polylepis.1
MLQGLAHLHAKGFMHRDLKPENVLCDEAASVLKLGDLGLAREIRSRPPHTDYVATRWYRAPELCLRSTVYSSPVDVWALGCMTCELYTQRALLPGSSDADMLVRIASLLGSFSKESWPEGAHLADRARLRLPAVQATTLRAAAPQASAAGLAFLSELLQWDPRKRLSCHAALSHDFIANRAAEEPQLPPTPSSGGAGGARPKGRGSQMDAARWQERSNNVPAKKMPGDVQELRALFDKYDTQQAGAIDLIGLRLLVAHEGLHRDAVELLATLDSNGSGSVEFDELARWWKDRNAGGSGGAVESDKLAPEDDFGAALAEMFATYDTDQSGQISNSELVPLLKDLGVTAAIQSQPSLRIAPAPIQLLPCTRPSLPRAFVPRFCRVHSPPLPSLSPRCLRPWKMTTPVRWTCCWRRWSWLRWTPTATARAPSPSSSAG